MPVVSAVARVVFLADAYAAALIVGVLLIAGIDPLDDERSLTVFLALSAALAAARFAWWLRHREELERSPEHHRDRERRGF